MRRNRGDVLLFRAAVVLLVVVDFLGAGMLLVEVICENAGSDIQTAFATASARIRSWMNCRRSETTLLIIAENWRP